MAVLIAACGNDVSAPSPSDPLRVVEMTPAPRTVAAAPEGAIVIRFDRPLRAGAVTEETLHVFGRWSGTVRGTISMSADRRAVTLVPERALGAGESVMVLLSRDVRAEDGATLGPSGWSAQFWTRARPATAVFTESQRLSTRPPAGTPSRAYGGIASDLDGDGAPDLAIVNEDTADLVVFLNRGAAGFVPTGVRHPLGRRASPSEPADFDRDGNTDIAVANITDGTVSILLGRGDGSFGPPQVIAVGSTPRGIAVLDADGDADADIATANFGADDITLLANDGGRFRVATRIEAGARGEWALAAADMDEDGVLDLVVGARQEQRIVTLRNTGMFSFAPIGVQEAGGGPWMIVTGDLDADGHEDVAAVNGLSNTAAILRGDGRGRLGPPAVHAIDPFALASDLGDLDGDGDLDWVTSSYSGDWRLFENRGGTLVVAGEIAPRTASSCALPFDADGDGDLDLALIDEEADEVIVVTNGAGR